MNPENPSKQQFLQLIDIISQLNSRLHQVSDSLYSSILALTNRPFDQISPDEWRQLTLNSLQALALLDIISNRTHLRTWNKPTPDSPPHE